jgi:hypothetical protein
MNRSWSWYAYQTFILLSLGGLVAVLLHAVRP